jgi:hypothetical protein
MKSSAAETHIGQVFLGSDRFDVLGTKPTYCYFNGVHIANTSDLDTFGPIVGMFILSACGAPETKIQVKGNPSYADFLKDMIDTITKSDQAKVFVLETKPDEITDNKPIEASDKLTMQSLDDYRESIKQVAECFDDTLRLANAILKTKLPHSAHGFKELDRTLARAKLATSELAVKEELCEIASEQIGTRIGQLIMALENKTRYPKIIAAAVNQTNRHFGTIKTSLSECLCSLHPLYDINSIFKKYTGYPATWFYDPTTYYSFSERFKDASDHLIELARSENSILKPLSRS